MSNILQNLLGCSFVLGRAGTGKTWGCLAAMAGELRSSPRGLPLVLLAPEQATAQLERRLATWPGLPGGTTRARVFSFHHLAREAFLRAGGAPGAQLGDVGRVMLLRQGMLARQGELTALGQSAAQPGVAETISATLLEFQRYGWRLADLEAWVAGQILEQGEASLTVRKARDLAILWRDFEAALAAGGWEDPAGMYERAAEAIRRSGWLDGAAVWIDGFASFTSLEMAVLDALLEKAERVSFALCLDPDHVARLEGEGSRGRLMRPRIGMERLFENMEETYFGLRDRLLRRGLPAQRIKVVRLPLESQPTRAGGSPPLVHLERAVLGKLNPAVCPDGVWGAEEGAGDEGPGAVHDGHIQPVELIEASDRRAEVEAVARRLVTLCRRGADAEAARPLLLWREVAVLARDLAPYEIHLRDVFGAFGIPYFLDRPRSVEGHPLTRSILSALGVLRAGWAGDAVLHHLKSGLSGLRDEDAVGAIENLIRATDPRGARWMRRLELHPQLDPAWAEAEGPLRRLEAELKECGMRGEGRGTRGERRESVELSENSAFRIPHSALCDDSPLTPRPSPLAHRPSPARAIWNYLEAVGAAARMEEWIEEARGRGDEEAVQIHEQAWEQTVAWLEEFEKIQAALPALHPRAERSFRESVQELIDLIEAALASTQARLIPPTLNQVTVGAVDRSRTPEVKVVFVIGMNEGEFPKLWQPDAVLGDEERDQLTRDGRRLGPDSQRKRLQEHFLAYIALTRASSRLVLSRPQVDDEGRVCDPSPYFRLVSQCFPKAPVHGVRRCGEGEAPEQPLRAEEWALRLSLALGRDLDPAHADARQALACQAELRRRTDLSPAQRQGLDLAYARLGPAQPVALDAAAASAFWGGGETLPVTALESYGECPFRFFVERMLRLERRQEAALSPADLGTLRHDLLDRLYNILKGKQGLNWGTVDPAAADRLIDVELARLAAEEPWRERLEASALGTLTLRAAGEDIKLFVRALHLAGRRCRFAQVASEWSFGQGGELAVQLGDRAFVIRGKVDRIDALETKDGRVGLLIDYKSGRRTVSLAKILEGIDLQLLTYALAWRRACEQKGSMARIGGVFYWPLAAPVREAEPGDGADADGGEAVDERWFEKVKPSGIFSELVVDQLDCEVGPGGKALAFGFRKTAAGKLHGGGQGHWPETGLEALLEHEARLIERLVGRIAQGRIEINPYLLGKTQACDRCGFGAVCRRADPVPLLIRKLEPCRREAALERLQSGAP